jgi:hypothetical protein
MSDRFDELVGEIEDPLERERLRRVHELLLSVEAPPEYPGAPATAPAQAPVVELPRRRRYAAVLIAAALAAVLFGAGYLVGGRSDDATVERVYELTGVNDGRGATGSIELLAQDAEENGNWPMDVLVRGLEPSTSREDYYELWLTKDGELAASCGRFTVHPGVTEVTLSVPFALRQYDEWVVTRRGSDEILLTTT